MAITVTRDIDTAERIGNSRLGILTGNIALDSSYPSNGYALTDISKYFTSMLTFMAEGEAGYLYAYDKAENKLIVYYPSGTPAVSGSSANTTPGASAAPSASINAGYLVYQVRENPDSRLLNTTTKVAWTAIDLTSLVPANAKAVLVRVSLKANEAGAEFKLRSDSSATDPHARPTIDTQVANVTHAQDVFVEVNEVGAERFIEYTNTEATATWTFCRVVLLGWYEAVTLPSGTHTHTGAAHLHAAGTLVTTAEGADEVGNGDDLSGVLLLQFVATGIINVP